MTATPDRFRAGRARRWAGALLPVAAGGLAWGHFEAGWVRFRRRSVAVRGLPEELAGIRVVHLSDFHLGIPSRGERAVERAVAWAASRRPDLTVISGDLLSRRRGERRLRELVAHLPRCFAVLGNHDFALGKDPFSQPAPVFDLGRARVLLDEACTIELRGQRVQIVGVDPRSYLARRARPGALVDRSAGLRVLVCHFPEVVDKLAPGDFHLVLAGHLHAGQITLPYPGGKLRLSKVRWRYVEGLYDTPAAPLHLSSGLGTTFVPFRFFARPEATELVLAPLDDSPRRPP